MILLIRSFPYALTYAVLTDYGNGWNWLFGALFGAILAFVRGEPPFPNTARTLARLARLPWFIYGSLRQIVGGSWRILTVLLGRRTWRHVGLVTCEEVARTDLGLAVLALVESASPGSLVADVDRKTKTVVISVIDATNPARKGRAITRFYDRFQKHLMP